MTLIVADTGPVNYLIQIGNIDLLGRLASETVLPESVAAELRHSGAPDAVRAWASAPPQWVHIRAAAQLVEAEELSFADREAIGLAKELQASVLLMDDQLARRCAARSGVPTLGTVGLLEMAAARGMISLPEALSRLRETSCFLSEDLIEDALRRTAIQRQRP
jgi:predicted nucleic acid-binding protein